MEIYLGIIIVILAAIYFSINGLKEELTNIGKEKQKNKNEINEDHMEYIVNAIKEAEDNIVSAIDNVDSSLQEVNSSIELSRKLARHLTASERESEDITGIRAENV